MLFPKAVVVKEYVSEAIAFEAELAKNYNNPPPAGVPWFKVLPGNSKVLIVAGHATAHMRDGKIKEVDGGTGSLAIMLNKLAGCATIHTTYQSPLDPNTYDDSDFKRTLKSMIDQHKPAIVLDIHSSNSSRPYDIDFGTIDGTSLLNRRDLLARLAAHLRREGMRNFSQDYFSAGRPGRVTWFVSHMDVPCVQLEINQNWLIARSPGTSDIVQNQRFAQTLQGLIRFIESIDAP